MGRFDSRDLPQLLAERLGLWPPEDRDERALSLDQGLDDAVCERCPAEVAVRARFSRPDRQKSIEEEDPLLRPVGEVAIARFGHPEIVAEFSVHICKRR